MLIVTFLRPLLHCITFVTFDVNWGIPTSVLVTTPFHCDNNCDIPPCIILLLGNLPENVLLDKVLRISHFVISQHHHPEQSKLLIITLASARAIIKVSGHQHQWFPGVSQVVTM